MLIFLERPFLGNTAVELKNPGVPLGREPVEKAAILTLPYFTEPCEGRTWDTSGRLYRRSNYPLEKNLIVPQVRWVSEFKVLIYAGKVAESVPY